MNFSKKNSSFCGPFSYSYWDCAFKELSSRFVIVFAANIIAARVVLDTFSIPFPFAESLYVSFHFLFDALGAYIYGPIVAILSSGITDILAYMISPKGPYYFPFTILEMLTSLIYALFLYKSKISVPRLLLSRLTVNFLINSILTPVLLYFMYGKSIFIYFVPRVIKNILIFPLEIFLLINFFRAILPLCRRFGIISKDTNSEVALALKNKHFIVLILSIICSIVFSYLWFRFF